MGENSKIEWCDHTFNPWHGCTKVSPACDHCYAESFAKRIGYSEAGKHFPIWGQDAGRRFFGDKHWAEPLKWNREAQAAGVSRRVFCGSMCDVMEDYNGTEHLVREGIEESRQWLYRLIETTPYLDWLLLTKRPQNYSRFFPQAWILRGFPSNVWLGTTMESPDYFWRVNSLREMYGVSVRFLSIEPLLQNLGALNLEGINWVIVGGESGSGARPTHPDWVRSIRDRCVGASVPFFFKQWGDYRPQFPQYPDEYGSEDDNSICTGREFPSEGVLYRSGYFYDGVEHQPHTGSGAWWIERVGKKAAGRLLDGREWNERPEAITA
jgi:protein gp37